MGKGSSANIGDPCAKAIDAAARHYASGHDYDLRHAGEAMKDMAAVGSRPNVMSGQQRSDLVAIWPDIRTPRSGLPRMSRSRDFVGGNNKSLRAFHHVPPQYFEQRMRSIGVALILCLTLPGGAVAQCHKHSVDQSASSDSPKTAFDLEMARAMDRMDADMMAAKPTGNPDHDFAAMMIPHHQGAIDMAKAQLLYGHDSVLRRLAQEIIVAQQQEMEVMRRALNDTAPAQQK